MSPGQATLEHGTGTLADLIADALAIPAAAYGVSKYATTRVIELVEPARSLVIAIPEAAATAFADYFG
ncbi:MAG TPA: hypothetical protein VHW74_01530 [Mycobacteriales bacterium]|jgi:hypothetical protein|nr:hypothetical protein [Mycobacteriales bacterium]